MPKLLFFAIDQKETEEQAALAVRIMQGEKSGLTLLQDPKQEVLTKVKLQALALPSELNLLSFLMREELAFLKKTKGRNFEDPKTPYNLIHISYSGVQEAFKLFALNGKLMFNEKSLVIDLFGKNELYYKVEQTNGLPTVQAWIKAKSAEFNACECDLIGKGPPHWFIKGPTLKFITTDIAWKDLQAIQQGVFSPYQQLIEEAKEDESAPRVTLNASFTIPVNEPLPLLILKDKHGSFGNLVMAYQDHGGNCQEIDYHSPLLTVEKGGKLFCKRQKEVEKGWEKDLLETGYTKKPLADSNYYCPLDKVAKSIAFLMEIGWQVRDVKGAKVVKYTDSQLTASASLDTICIKGKLRFNTFEADLTDVMGAFNRRERFCSLGNGQVALLPASLEEIGLQELVNDGEIVADGVRIKKNHFGTLATLLDTSISKIRLDETITALKTQLTSFSGIGETLLGTGFRGTLRPYQQAGLNWLSFLHAYGFHGILADDMGLGKTVQVLAFLSTLAESKDSKQILIVVPTSLLFNWKNEINAFLPAAHVTIHHGPKRAENAETLIRPHFQIILTTYSTAKSDAALFQNIDFECLILDEAQNIKNASTQNSKVLCSLNSALRLSITGTPVENNLMELWSHFRFLIPDLFGDEESFQAEMRAGESDPRFLKRIKKKIRPFLLRRRKEEVAKDLPEKIEQTVSITMHEQQRVLYEQFLSGVRQNLITKIDEGGTGKHRMEILESIMRLRQICCHPLLVMQEEIQGNVKSAKLEALLEDLETALKEERKVLVYSQFTQMLGIIGKHLKEQGIRYAYLDGSTKDREAVVASFQNDPSLQIFLLSLKAGGVGLNLTAADYVFLYDPWWNDAVEAQAIDRAHRIGQKNTVIAKRYVTEDSIEQKLMKLKSLKSTLASALFDEEEGAIGSPLSLDDLLFLIS